MNETFSGLTTIESEKRLKKYGANELSGQSKASVRSIFFRQFKNFLVLLLLIASLISFFVGEALDAIIILLILFMNILLGFFQEYKAENALESLKKLTVSRVRVIREGKEQLIDSKHLVPGDIVKIEEGDKK